jgi:peptidoglycan/LPS O-acetylase OafA/YrhL
MNTSPLTFTRFIASIIVVIFHFGKEVFPFNSDFLKAFIDNGDICVSFFFFLSGFVMVIAYYDKVISGNFDIKNFWKRRFSRIYPLYILALFSTMFLLLKFRNYNLPISEVSLNILLLQSWFGEKIYPINFPGWTLSIEFFFYLCFPFIISKVIRWKNSSIIASTVLIWVVSQVLFFTTSIFYSPLFHLNTFICGITLGLLIKKEDPSIDWLKKHAQIILYISIALLILIIGTKNIISEYSHNGLLAPLFATTIIGLIYTQGRLTNLISKRPFIIAGKISYGIYILQYPCTILMLYINDILTITKNETYFFYLYLLLLIIVSWFAYYTFENPVKKFIDKRF